MTYPYSHKKVGFGKLELAWCFLFILPNRVNKSVTKNFPALRALTPTYPRGPMCPKHRDLTPPESSRRAKRHEQVDGAPVPSPLAADAVTCDCGLDLTGWNEENVRRHKDGALHKTRMTARKPRGSCGILHFLSVQAPSSSSRTPPATSSSSAPEGTVAV
eukprot:GHVU01078051.1.p1 GENE.GHVU01078051.1~~GHVU01078051.1.p1  ORF type:complete len:160 (+),score=12.30 GHVU01078051.1:589-1068(+)